MVEETLVGSLGGDTHDSHRTDDASDIVVIAVHVGICQRMTKANVGVRIGWILDDADRLSNNEAHWDANNRLVGTLGLGCPNNVSPKLAPVRRRGRAERRILLGGLAR